MINPRTASQCSRLCVDFGPLTSGNSNVIDLLPLAWCPMWIVCHRKFRANLHRRMYVVFTLVSNGPTIFSCAGPLCRKVSEQICMVECTWFVVLLSKMPGVISCAKFRVNLLCEMYAVLLYVVCCSFVQNARCNLLCKIQSKSTLQNVRGFTLHPKFLTHNLACRLFVSGSSEQIYSGKCMWFLLS